MFDAMEPEVIRMYSSSPPPMDEGTEEEDSEFGDFGAFSAVAASLSFTELDTPSTFNQTQALDATSPPELLASRGVPGISRGARRNEPLKANGVAPAGHRGDDPSDRTESSEGAGSPVSEAGGGGLEALTNGFVTFDLQGSPSLQNSVHAHCKGTSTEDPDAEDDFADFASFADAKGGVARPEAELRQAEWRASAQDALRDPNRTTTRASESTSAPAEAPDGSDRGPGPHNTNRPATLNGLHAADGADRSQSETERIHGKSSDTETETETSLGRPLSTDALEEYGELSTPGSTPSPPLQGDAATPADHQDDRDFGDAAAFAAPGFPECEQEAEQARSRHSSAPSQQRPEEGDEDFGDFNRPQFQSEEEEEAAAEMPVSDSFGNFSWATDAPEADSGWSAFGEAEQEEGAESWVAFSTEPDIRAPAEGREEEEQERAAVRGESRTTVSGDDWSDWEPP